MGLRSQLAISAGKTAQWVLKTFFKGGSSYPGQLALKMDPKILDTLVKLQSGCRNWNQWENLNDRFDRKYFKTRI